MQQKNMEKEMGLSWIVLVSITVWQFKWLIPFLQNCAKTIYVLHRCFMFGLQSITEFHSSQITY